MRRAIRVLNVVLAFVGFLLGSVLADSAEHWAAYVSELGGMYDFANWPGKDGAIRDGFRITPDMLPEGLVFKRISGPGARVDGATGLLCGRTRYVLTPTHEDGQLQADVSVAGTCGQAQERLLELLVNTQRAQPPLTPRGTEYGLDLGDICFVGRGREGHFHSAMWVRNNIFARVWADGEDMRPFVEPLARALDAGILRRATFKSYVECGSRPVITKVERTSPDERQRLEVEWKAVEVRAPEGEEVVLVPSQAVLPSRYSVPLVREWGGVSFQVAVSESNLVGLPLSGIAEWKQNGPEPERVNARINAFLKRFEPPSQGD